MYPLPASDSTSRLGKDGEGCALGWPSRARYASSLSSHPTCPGALIEVLFRARFGIFPPNDVIPIGIDGASDGAFVRTLSDVLEIGALAIRRLDYLCHVREPEALELLSRIPSTHFRLGMIAWMSAVMIQ